MIASRAAVATVLMLPVAAAAAVARPVPVAIATAETPPSVQYVVKPGDTLVDLANRALVRPQDWQMVARINHVADPRRLPVGKTLLIPAALLRREPLTAAIAAFSGQVTTTPGGAARLGAPVGAGTLLATGPNSFVTLALADGSRVTLPSQSRIRIALLERIVIDGRLERRFELVSGRSEFGVTPRARDADRFLVKTPVAVAAVRGTEFRVAYDGDHESLSVIEGVVAERPLLEHDDDLIASGGGAVMARGDDHPATLLPAPALVDPGREQADPAVVFALAPGAGTRRRVQLARDAGFIDRFAETETTGDTASFDGVGNGTLYARLTAIDGEGVEGLHATYEFERFQSGLATEAGALPGKPRRSRFRWQPSGEGSRRYDFVLARDAALVDRIIDAPMLASTEMTVSGLQPGTWYWRVTVTAIAGGKRHVRMLPVQALTIARPH